MALVELNRNDQHPYDLEQIITALGRVMQTGKVQRGDYADLQAARDLLEGIQDDCSLLGDSVITFVDEPLLDDIDYEQGELADAYV